MTKEFSFPDVSMATQDGLLAVGGDLQAERLILAYKSGIFPWFEDDRFLMWWSPDPRFVLFPKELKISKSMAKLLRDSPFKVTYNQAFQSVLERCAHIKRKGQSGTWITQDMIDAYSRLHQMGYAKSVEVWQNGRLAGGLYGVDLKNGVFCGESMFAAHKNASKYGFIKFVLTTDYKLIDCQVRTAHLESFGARFIAREEFLKWLNRRVNLS